MLWTHQLPDLHAINSKRTIRPFRCKRASQGIRSGFQEKVQSVTVLNGCDNSQPNNRDNSIIVASSLSEQLRPRLVLMDWTWSNLFPSWFPTTTWYCALQISTSRGSSSQPWPLLDKLILPFSSHQQMQQKESKTEAKLRIGWPCLGELSPSTKSFSFATNAEELTLSSFKERWVFAA